MAKPPEIKPPAMIAKGILRAPARGWYTAYYYDPLTGAAMTFPERPTVVAVAELRTGRIPSVTAPTISIPRITLPSAPTIDIPDVGLKVVSITKFELAWWKCRPCGYTWLSIVRQYRCPECRRTDILGPWTGRKAAEDALKSLYWWSSREGLGDWVILNWARDLIIGAFQWLGIGMGRVTFALWDTTKAQVDEVISRVNAAFRSMIGDPEKPVSGSLNRALDDLRYRIRDSVNAGLSDARDKTQDALNTYRSRIQSAINAGLGDIIPTLYSMMGLPDGQLVSPVNIRNVSTANFQFYSLSSGMILHYVAVGKPPVPLGVPLPPLPGGR